MLQLPPTKQFVVLIEVGIDSISRSVMWEFFGSRDTEEEAIELARDVNQDHGFTTAVIERTPEAIRNFENERRKQ